MRISIFGLGYVGAVSSGCLAKDGHEIVGCDPVQAKIDLINQGKAPIIEKDVGGIIRAAVKDSRLRATKDSAEAVRATDLSFICVGTPSQRNGNLDLKYVRKVCEEIGSVLKDKSDYHTVVVRSTILPGSMRKVVIPTLEERSGKKAGRDFGICFNPEFLREGTAVFDFYNPPKTVIGELDAQSGDLLSEIYSRLDAPLIRTSLETAEMVKYTDNTWHALKICFANEIGGICDSVGVNPLEVMDIFCQDKKLNISRAYLRPGFAFGGSCLPKDVRALSYLSRKQDLDLPVLQSVLPSNEYKIATAVREVMNLGKKKVGVLGISFKAGTDDLRESPVVEVVERLLGKGYDIRIFDRNVKIASIHGANKDYILNVIPHISNLMVDSVEELLEFAEIILIGNMDPEFKNVPGRMKPGHRLVDLVRLTVQAGRAKDD